VQGDGKALRYGVGVGRPGFTWSGVKTVFREEGMAGLDAAAEMLARRPDLPRHMEAAAKIRSARGDVSGFVALSHHGSNEPGPSAPRVVGLASGLRNEDVIDLYGRVGVGAGSS